MLSKINKLIHSISRTSYEGLGKLEPLKHKYRGFWSRRIHKEHRLIYRLTDQNELWIVKCRFHYD